MIQNVFDELQPYLIGLKSVERYKILECNLKKSWRIKDLLNDDDKEILQITQQKKDGIPNGYLSYIFYVENESFDFLVDVLKLLIKSNIDIENKEFLLKNKIEELKRIFEEKPLTELENLNFSTSKEDKTKKDSEENVTT
jgi:hypothetical protein